MAKNFDSSALIEARTYPTRPRHRRIKSCPRHPPNCAPTARLRCAQSRGLTGVQAHQPRQTDKGSPAQHFRRVSHVKLHRQAAIEANFAFAYLPMMLVSLGLAKLTTVKGLSSTSNNLGGRNANNTNVRTCHASPLGLTWLRHPEFLLRACEYSLPKPVTTHVAWVLPPTVWHFRYAPGTR